MALQEILLKKPRLAQSVLEKLPAKYYKSKGEKKAIDTYMQAIHVRAYVEFLRSSGREASKISSYDGFQRLPIMDKESYISKFQIEDLTKVSIPDNYTIEESSGYGGKPYFWVRYSGQDDNFLNYMQLGLNKIYNVHKKSTLLLNCFALGTWVTGVKFARFASMLANSKNNKITVVNIGTDKFSTIRYLLEFSKFYDQIIIAGYPPFIMDTINELSSNIQKKDPILKKINILAGGEGFTEEWRRNMLRQLGSTLLDFKNMIVSALGSADTGLEIGYEQPITILFRDLLYRNADIRKEVLGEKLDYVPSFFQYNPMNIWIEEEGGELIYTSDGGIPIVRYNLHDSGGIISFETMMKYLGREYNVKDLMKKFRPFKLPACYVIGRSDGSVSIDGANIYVQDIKSVFDNVQELCTYMKIRFKSLNQIQDILNHKKLAKTIWKNTSIMSDINICEKIGENFINSFKIRGINNKLELFVELRQHLYLDKETLNNMNLTLLQAIVILLSQHSTSYKSLLDEELSSAFIELHIEEYNQGVFKDSYRKIKYNYLATSE